MADTLTALLRLLVSATFTKDLDLADPKDTLAKTIEQAFESGVGSGQANMLFHDKRTLGDGANESLDLAGVLTSSFGATLTFAKVKALIIKNLSATQTLSIGGGGVNSFINWVGDASDIVKIAPSGFLCLVAPAGYAVTADTGDLLKILNSAGAAADYEIIIIGSSS